MNNDSGRRDQSSSDRPLSDDNVKRSFVIHAVSCTLTPLRSRPMPITCVNELPHISFPLGHVSLDDDRILALFDTGAAVNTGYLPYHTSIIENNADLVERFERFDDATNPFDPMKLHGAIGDPKDYDESTHGILSAVVTYKTPLRHRSSGERITISFALGDDMSVNTIIGLPFIREYKFDMRFYPDERYYSHVANQTFFVIYRTTSLTRSQKRNDSDDSGPPISPFAQSPANYFVPTDRDGPSSDTGILTDAQPSSA